MAGVTKQAILVLTTMAAIAGICSAATLTVGDSTGWTIPSSSSFYSNWASKNKIQAGDTLVFTFPAGAHTVAEVSKSAYDSCSTSSPIGAVKTTAPANITISSGGTHYFICTITGHCAAGQKLAVTASGSSATAPAPRSSKATPSPAQAPSTGGGAAMPPTSAATSPSGAEGPSGTTTPGAESPAGTFTPAAEGPAGGAAVPPSGNFAAPTAAGFGLLSLVSVAAAAILF